MKNKICLLILMILASSISYATEYKVIDSIYLDKNGEIISLNSLNFTENQVKNKSGIKAIKYLRMAKTAYNNCDYENCLSYIKEYEKRLKTIHQDIKKDLTLEEQLTIVFYKAFSRKFMKNYKSAIDSFDEAIELLEQADFPEKECLWSAYYHKASCYWGLGKKIKCQEKISDLALMNLGPSLQDLNDRGHMIIRQPNLLNGYPQETDPLLINKSALNQMTNHLLEFHQSQLLVPKTCSCPNKNARGPCSKNCTRQSSYAAVAASFISHLPTQIKVLLALIDFEIKALDCCESCLSHEKGPENLNLIIESALHVYLKDEDEKF
jgi:hypothetical protein